uniref:(northern house mosquito) hypothetical protein n=1 Tax=Culex pipiens TaxID=7175 RepID=A0A8D8HJM6_CULPI
MEETEPSVTKVDAMLQTENSDQLHLQINEISNKYTFLVKTSEQKDDLIKLLIKEKNILDGEKILLQKEHQSAVKDKEIIVMRFAIVEKNLLDAKNHIEQLEKKEKKILKETEALNSRIKILKDEKQNVNTLLEIKVGNIY